MDTTGASPITALRCLLGAAGELGSLEQKKDKTQGAHGEEEHPKGRQGRGTSHPMPGAQKAQRVVEV